MSLPTTDGAMTMSVQQTESGFWQVIEILDNDLVVRYNVYSSRAKARAAIRRMLNSQLSA